MSSSRDVPSTAIIGGGISGLLLALSIGQHAPHLLPGLTLYEAAPKFGEIGAGVAFGPNAVRAMNRISPGVKKGFEAVSTGNKSAEKRRTWFDFWCGMDGRGDVKDGKWICEKRVSGSEGGGMVHRANFLDEMVKLVTDEINVKFDRKAVGFEQAGERVLIKFADGTEAKHDAVIGCDGIKSQTRVHLLGREDPAAYAVYTGKYCYRGLIPMEQAVEALGEQLATNSQMYWGYHGHMLTFPVRDGKIMNVVAFTSSEKWEANEWVVHADREKMYRDYEGWGKNVRKILEMMQKPDIWALFNHPPAKSYCKGRICLIGDAAHASTPHQGAGAGMSVEDAYVMSMALKGVQIADDFDAAFVAFDEVRRERTQKLVTTSKECGQLYDFELPGYEDNISKLKENMEDERLEWIWKFDIEKDVEAVTRIFQERRGR